jgi:adenylyltransferase/sulfurtransferase
MATTQIIESLKQQITLCEARLRDLGQQLADAQNYQQLQKEQEQWEQQVRPQADPLGFDFAHGIHDDFTNEIYAALSKPDEQRALPRRWPLDKHEYKRYGRQMIMPEIGLQGIYFVWYQ